MSEEDKELQKHLVDEMMKVSETNPDVMLYMQSLMENYEKLEKENQQLKELCNKYEEEHKKEFNIWLQGQKVLKDLEEWLKEEQERYRDYLLTRPKNDSEYNSKYATQCALSQVDIILDKIQELRNKYEK